MEAGDPLSPPLSRPFLVSLFGTPTDFHRNWVNTTKGFRDFFRVVFLRGMFTDCYSLDLFALGPTTLLPMN